jgi:hypothetical protein
VVYVRGYVKSSTRGIIKKNDGGWVTHDESDVHIGGVGSGCHREWGNALSEYEVMHTENITTTNPTTGLSTNKPRGQAHFKQKKKG